jgi:hypothetical protein
VPCEILKLRNERQRNKFEAAIARQIGSWRELWWHPSKDPSYVMKDHWVKLGWGVWMQRVNQATECTKIQKGKRGDERIIQNPVSLYAQRPYVAAVWQRSVVLQCSGDLNVNQAIYSHSQFRGLGSVTQTSQSIQLPTVHSHSRGLQNRKM